MLMIHILALRDLQNKQTKKTKQKPIPLKMVRWNKND